MCFAGGGWNVNSSGEDTLEMLSQINFSQVISTSPVSRYLSFDAFKPGFNKWVLVLQLCDRNF